MACHDRQAGAQGVVVVGRVGKGRGGKSIEALLYGSVTVYVLDCEKGAGEERVR